MNSKNIAKHLHAKLTRWMESVEDESVKKIIKDSAIVTGGALVSLLNGEEPKDYDIYFKTEDACKAVAQHYVSEWNKRHPDKNAAQLQHADGRIQVFIKSKGIVSDEDTDGEQEPYVEESETEAAQENPKYRPKFMSTNAISLTDKIQLVIRFYGSVEKIHDNYDFIHCTCSYDFKENKVSLPARALEAIINKELYYSGSKYPLCSIIRTRKFVGRGWHINAGQYLKMALQLNELDLKDMNVFKDQLAGVDSYYFEQAISAIQAKKEEDPDFNVDNTYLFEIINRIF